MHGSFYNPITRLAARAAKRMRDDRHAILEMLGRHDTAVRELLATMLFGGGVLGQLADVLLQEYVHLDTFNISLVVTVIAGIMLVVRISQTPIVVEFSAAPQLSGDEAVVLGGQVIGRAEQPRVRNGVVEVIVNLRHNDSVKDQTLFVLDTAPNYGTVLVAIPRGNNIVIDRNSRLRFRGAASRAELAMMLTKDNIVKTTEWPNDTITAAIRGLQE